MNNALSNNRPTRGRDDASMYDVSTYTDVELFNILDVDSPTDRELEAKIIFLINKYRNVQNASGDQLADFFEKIYRRFFEADDEGEIDNFEDDEGDDAEGFMNIREGISNQEIVNLTTPPANKVTNVTNATSPSSVVTVNPTAQGNSVVKTSPDNIGYTKSLEYANGKLNPLLQQTIKRIISIDSQYRDDKRTLSTEFTFNLSDPLKDVVSLKLYSVQIPYTWYTINNNFGSNFFVLKGDVPGINNGNHDYQIDIAAGNYSPQSLTDTINESITLAKKTYSDVSFGNTALSYNSNTSLITTTIDLQKQYNETSYYLNFPTTSDIDNSATWLNSIPGFLGFTQEKYEMFHLESARTLPLTTDIANENTRFTINIDNNYFTVYKYIGDEYNENQVGKQIDLTWKIVIGLADGSYTRSQLTTALNTAIQNNKYLSTTETLIERKSGIQRIDASNNSYFVLKLKSNRNTTNNISGSKIQVKFPVETGADKKIWSGINSCFQFNPNSSLVMEINNLISERSPIQQSDAQYIIASSPYISLVCKSKGYDVSNTRYKIRIENAVTVPYNLTNYISAINSGFVIVDNSSNFTADNTLAKIDSENIFNAQIDLTKNIITSMFKLDLSNSFLHTDLNFASSYNLDINGGVYTSSFPFKNNYTIPSTSTKMATFSGQIAGACMTSDLSYTVMHPSNRNVDLINNTASTPYVTGLERTLEVTINQQFENFKDSDGVNVLSGTNIRLVANQDNTVTATLTVSVNKQLTESDYSIQFLEDISYNITQTGFRLDVSGGVDGNPGTYITRVNGGYDLSLSTALISSGLGVLSKLFDLSGGGNDIYDMQTANVFTSQFDISDISNNQYTIDTSYIAFLVSAVNPAVDTPYYGRSFRYGSTVPYGYLIPSPTTRIYNDISGLVYAINTQFSLFPDLSGTLLTINQISTTTRYNASLRVVVNQRYNQDTWYKNLKISRQMIDASWNLSNSSLLSYSTTNAFGSVALGIKGESIIEQKAFACNATNNTFELVPYEEGVLSMNNNLIFTLPLKNADGNTITYTRTRLLDEINNQFLGTVAEGSKISIITSDTGVEYTKFRITINKEYTSKDYRIVYYDPYSFVKCFSGVNSVRNVTWDTTLGWILGYRLSTIYYLSDYTSTRMVTITGDTSISTNLFNYFLITLDDYNQNHLNDGLVTITAKDTDIPLPSYANRTNYTCDPVTKELTYNTEQRTDYSKLTQNQIYALNQVANSKNVLTNQVTAGEVSSKNYGSGPFAKDVFGIIPLKLAGLQNGTSFVEFGGTLQNQERIYFGPVNIHRMSVKLLSDRGNVVDLNGANWSFSLVCEQLYRPQQRE